MATQGAESWDGDTGCLNHGMGTQGVSLMEGMLTKLEDALKGVCN